MNRTRKWDLVAQEARRLAALGLSPKDIGARVGVDWSTVYKWMRDGRLEKPAAAEEQLPASPAGAQTPEQWSSAIRATYQLDATDGQLVTMAEAALRRALDLRQPASVQLSAMGRFQAIVKQLNLAMRGADEREKPGEPEKEPARPRPALVRRTGTDPRALLVDKP